jgi:hypothetical protein
MRLLITFALCLQLLAPAAAWAQAKDPLNYPLKQYGFMLATAVLGGLVSWYAKVRKGEVSAWGVNQLVGELATSAFAGLICFWGCEAMGLQQIWTAPLVGIAGHMGTRAITAFEEFAQRRWAPKE